MEMKGSCIIDGVDISGLGMFILKGGDFDLISFPERKPPLSNNWFEKNGIEADLSEVFFKEKQVTIKFHISAYSGLELVANLARFRAVVTAPGNHEVYIREFRRSFFLRYVSCPELDHRGGLAKVGKKSTDLSVRFSMDDPLQIFNNPDVLEPVREYTNNAYVSIGGRDLSEYGIIVTECYNSMLAFPEIKKPLQRSFNRASGLWVSEPEETTFEAKQVTISCTMRALSLETFYHNYEALFNALTIKEALQVTTYAGDEECFYSSMKNFRKRRPFKERVLVDFDLQLTCLDTGLVNFLLASEDERLFVTEDDIYYIDMAYEFRTNN